MKSPGDLLKNSNPSVVVGRSHLQERPVQKQPFKLADFLLSILKLRGFIKVDKAKIAPGFSVNEARIGTVEGGEFGLLVWKFDQLVAVLTRIDEEAYSMKGKWFLETGFGLLSGQHRNFETIEEAISWVGKHTFPDPAPTDRSADPRQQVTPNRG